MKTVIIFLLLISPFLLLGQNEVQYSHVFCNSFLEQLKQQVIPDSFRISPKYQHNNSFPQFDFSYPLPGIHKNGISQKNDFMTDNSNAIFSRMPIVKSDFQPNMPISVPDSSVHFFIVEKRIRLINPLE